MALGAIAVALALSGAAAAVPAPAEPTVAAADWLAAPAPLEVAKLFDAPESEWGAGHRGIDLWLDEGIAVGAPGGGIVTFAGEVAGRGIVVILHPSGLRSTLEPVLPLVAAGDKVRAGDAVGALELAGSHCAPRACLHWGVRDGANYVDPLDFLAGYGPIRLLPLWGLVG